MHRDTEAATAIGPSCSYWKTWAEFHEAVFGDANEGTLPVLPLTHEKIMAVSALFKSGGYRAYKNYLNAAKNKHLQHFEWTTMLGKIARDAARSVLRGIGPARQSATLDINAVFKLKDDGEPLVEHGPVGAINMIILGMFFLLREIEASLSLASSVSIEPNSKRVTWNLPATKTDPMALGKVRSWECTCDGKRRCPCPFHAASDQQKILTKLFATDGGLPPNLPLFPTKQGQTVEKEAVVRTIEKVASTLQVETHNESGDRLFGGHTLRISGAQHMAAIGIDTVIIALLARWQSSIVLRYAAEAPLQNISDTYRSKLQSFNLKGFIRQIKDEMLDMRSETANLHSDFRTAITEEIAAHKLETASKQNSSNQECKTNPLESSSQIYYIKNDDPGIFHLPQVHGIAITPFAWTTKCGWKFGTTVMFSTVTEIEPTTNWKHVCGKCLQDMRDKLMNEQAGEVSSATSDSSSSDAD